MDLISVTEYAARISAIVWLIWLASRPFLVNLNRLLFVVFGWLAHGFLALNLVIPLTGVQTAYMEANREMAKLEKLPSPSGIFPLDEPTIRYFLSIGILLAVFFLLMLWLQRVLARCPREGPRRDTNSVSSE